MRYLYIIILILTLVNAHLILSEEITPESNIDDVYVYTIGAGDKIEISIWGYPELTRQLVVRPDGRITYEMIGDIHAAGLTPTQLSEKLKQKLTYFLRKPTVIVKIIELKSQMVTVIGDVAQPGTHYLEGPTRLLDLLTSVGWSPANSQAKEVIIMRNNNNVIRINLEDLLYNGNPTQNIYLKSKDTIIIRKPMVGYITVDGEVGKPGKYEVEKAKKMRVTDILREAGGVTNSAVLTRARIVRSSGFEMIVNLEALKYMGDQNENYMLNEGDRLYIPRVKQTTIYIFGQASQKGIVKINDPEPTIAKLIAITDYEYFAVLSDIKVIREDPLNPGHPIVFDVDLKKVMYLKDSSQNIKLENYDVIYVPQSFVGSFTEFIDEVWPTITTGAEAVQDSEDIIHGEYGQATTTTGRK